MAGREMSLERQRSKFQTDMNFGMGSAKHIDEKNDGGPEEDTLLNNKKYYGESNLIQLEVKFVRILIHGHAFQIIPDINTSYTK